MSVNYSIAIKNNPQGENAPRKAYAVSQIKEELSLKALSRRIADETTVSRADIVAVLIATAENIVEALQEGYQVDFGELGKFRLNILSEGAESIEKFTANNIKGVSIQFIPGAELKDIFGKLEFTPVATRAAQRAVLRAEKAGQTTVDISKKPKKEAPEGEGGNPATGD